MPALDEALYDQIKQLCAEGNELADSESYEASLVKFNAALALLPEPKESYGPFAWISVAIGDVLFLMERYPEARGPLMATLKTDDDARANPFITLRMGQVCFELGEEAKAEEWLTHAFMADGMNIFEGEDPKYWNFIAPKLAPPPGGWS
jgi:tetratricopeptide (TPR) repeat protein